jgi:hypothetical protein
MERNDPGFRSLLFVSRPLRMLMRPTALRNGLHTDRRFVALNATEVRGIAYVEHVLPPGGLPRHM